MRAAPRAGRAGIPGHDPAHPGAGWHYLRRPADRDPNYDWRVDKARDPGHMFHDDMLFLLYGNFGSRPLEWADLVEAGTYVQANALSDGKGGWCLYGPDVLIVAGRHRWWPATPSAAGGPHRRPPDGAAPGHALQPPEPAGREPGHQRIHRPSDRHSRRRRPVAGNHHPTIPPGRRVRRVRAAARSSRAVGAATA